jgi:hypothetical protein
MTTPATPSAPQKSGDDRNLVAVDKNYVAPSVEDRIRLFWEKNRQLGLGVLVAVLVAIVAKGGWDYLETQKELETQQAYAAAGTPEKLKAFAAAHPDHPLAGVAQLQLADQAYAAGKSADATAAYTQAAALLQTGPLASRARLGLAMAQLQAGKTADGESGLKQLLANAAQPKGARAEAAYHLASLALTQHRNDDAKKFSDQVSQIDPASPWGQRAMLLRASLPVTEAAPAAGAPAILLPPPKK